MEELRSSELRGAKARESLTNERHNCVLYRNHAVDNATVNADGHPRFPHTASHGGHDAEVKCPNESNTDSQCDVVAEYGNSVDNAVDLQRAGQRVKHWHNRSEKDG